MSEIFTAEQAERKAGKGRGKGKEQYGKGSKGIERGRKGSKGYPCYPLLPPAIPCYPFRLTSAFLYLCLYLYLSVSCALWCRPEASFGQEGEIVEEGLDPESGSAVRDRLEDLEAHPIDMNRATAAEWSALPGISTDQADRIVRWRKQHGVFRDIEDLGKVEGMDEEAVERLRGYLTCLKPSSPGESAFRPIMLQCRMRLWCPDGSEKHPLFKAWRIYSKTSLSAGDGFRVGWVTEKDPEEAHAYDFIAGYVEIRDRWGFDQIVIGDFRPGFGQHVLFSRSDRSMDGLGLVKKHSTNAVGYRSSAETGALRGLLLKRTMGPWEGILFGARTRSDAVQNEAGAATGYSFGGRHVTETERARSDVLVEELVGGRFKWHKSERTRIGLTLSHSRFRPPWGQSDEERDRFAFVGSQIEHLSVDWDLFLFGLNVFGEAVCSHRAGNGIVVGWIWREGGFTLESLIRGYGRRFRTFHGSGFSVSGSEDGNEIGAFHGVVWRIRSGSQFSAYFDQYRRPWRSYSAVLPTGGTRFGAELRHRLSRAFETMLRVRSSSRQSTPSVGGEYALTEEKRKELRWEGRWRSGALFRLKARVDHVWADGEQGSALFGDVRFCPRKRLVFQGRLTFFDVSAYEARVYEFESGLRGMFSIRSWSGRGRRWYFLMQVPFGRSALSLKYSRTYRLSEEEERTESAFGMQVDVTL